MHIVVDRSGVDVMFESNGGKLIWPLFSLSFEGVSGSDRRDFFFLCESEVGGSGVELGWGVGSMFNCGRWVYRDVVLCALICLSVSRRRIALKMRGVSVSPVLFLLCEILVVIC